MFSFKLKNILTFYNKTQISNVFENHNMVLHSIGMCYIADSVCFILVYMEVSGKVT